MITEEKLKEILAYIIKQHEEALFMVRNYEDKVSYYSGSANAYGDIRQILCSWLMPEDRFTTIIREIG